MSVQHGMDSGRVRQIAGQLRGEVQALTNVLGEGNASAERLREHWLGDDGQELVVRWTSDAAKQIGAATETLRALATGLERQAEDQDEASGAGGSGGPGAGGSRGTGTVGDGAGQDGPRRTYDRPSGYDIFERDPGSMGIRTNRDEHGNLHHYDPLTGRTWQEGADGTWRDSQSIFGDTHTDIRTSEHDGGWETTRESTRGTGGRGEWGESWSHERSFDNEGLATTQAVLDNVQSEPIVEQDLWDAGVSDRVAGGHVGDDQTGASGEVLSYNAETQGSMGVDATRGAYIEAGAEAGAYLARGEAHWGNDHGTTANAEGYIGAEAEAGASGQIGPAGAQVEAGFEAFAGGSIEGGVSQDLGPADVGVSGSLSYGIGVEADVGAEVSMEEISISADIGATLGVGGSLSFDVSISPNEIVDGLADAGQALADSPINPGNWW